MRPEIEWSDHTYGTVEVGLFVIKVASMPDRHAWRSTVRLRESILFLSPVHILSDGAYECAWDWLTSAVRPVAQAEGWVK